MSTSRIFITGQQSVEINNSELDAIKYQQARSIRLHVRLLLMVLSVAASFVVTALKYTMYIAFGVHLFFVFFNPTEVIDLIGSMQKASPVEIVDMLRGTLMVCALLAFMAVAFMAVFSPAQFGFKNIFDADLFSRLAEKLNIKAHQIESVHTDL